MGQKNSCSTIYPIILVHGVSFRDDVPFVKYWGNLPKILEKHGACVYLSHTNAFASHVENALQLREKVLEILEETGSEKVNIIAHSKGGIESRYMISRLDMADRVASLTTLATPHRGSYIADTLVIFFQQKHWIKKAGQLANIFGRFIGDEYPDALTAAANLRVGYMRNFNQSVPDMSQVYYQSFGGVITAKYPVWIVKIQHKILSEKEGENDGIVSLNSYRWGNFKGVPAGNHHTGVSHFDIIGFKIAGKNAAFDADKFMIDICMGLKAMGF